MLNTTYDTPESVKARAAYHANRRAYIRQKKALADRAKAAQEAEVLAEKPVKRRRRAKGE